MATERPWELSREEFDKVYKPVRLFHQYDTNTRANLMASHRTGHRRRHAVGEYFYIHPLLPNRAFDTPSQARWSTRYYVVEQAVRDRKVVPLDVLEDFPDLLRLRSQLQAEDDAAFAAPPK